VLRIEVTEAGQGAMPPIDLDDASFMIGSAVGSRVRLPATAAHPDHVRVEGDRWYALGPVSLDGAPAREGAIGEGVTLVIETYRVRISPSPPGAVAAPVQRTESLARELLRNIMGNGAQPTLEIERGKHAGKKRTLAPPESKLVIGRGDDVDWHLDDNDLSRTHAEVRRGWDGIRIFDLDSKNGTKVDGDKVTREGLMLRDGCVVELGPIVMRFRDPAEKHLQGDAPAFRPLLGSAKRHAEEAAAKAAADRAAAAAAVSEAPRLSTAPFYAALVIMVLALAGLVWVLSS
jgi:hypothetical protein